MIRVVEQVSFVAQQIEERDEYVPYSLRLKSLYVHRRNYVQVSTVVDKCIDLIVSKDNSIFIGLSIIGPMKRGHFVAHCPGLIFDMNNVSIKFDFGNNQNTCNIEGSINGNVLEVRFFEPRHNIASYRFGSLSIITSEGELAGLSIDSVTDAQRSVLEKYFLIDSPIY
jgi:hypothetical protein